MSKTKGSNVVEGFHNMLTGRLPADPPGGAWFLGTPGCGRRAIPMAPR